MNRSLITMLVLLLAAQAALGAVVAGPAALPPSAVAAAFGPEIGAQALAATNAISLRSAALTLSTLDQLRASYPSIADPGQKAAATAVLAALSVSPADLHARLAETDLPAKAVARIEKIAARLDDAGRKANADLVARALEHPDRVLSGDLLATFKAFMGWSAGVTPEAPPVVEAKSDWTGSDFKSLLSKRPEVSFGDESVPIITLPTVGDDISANWVKIFGQADSLKIATYNFDDMNMARAIVAASRAGKKISFIGDYSNFFPDREPQSGHGGKDEPRTEAMQYVIDNLNANLELWILQGEGGKSAIQHNKFSVFGRKDQKLAQAGSFNYTGTSQKNHWENVVYTDDADRIDFLEKYHAWMTRRARRYDPDLMPESPTFPEDDPIPEDPSRLDGVPLPKMVGTPKSQAESWLVKFLGHGTQDVLGAMFALFPTPDEVAAIKERLAAGIPVTFIVDRGQISRAGALWGLREAGMRLLQIAGPETGIYHTRPDPAHSKQHMKVVAQDGGALAKVGDSLNLSGNASGHNFENIGFHQGYVAAFIYAYIKEVMLPLASELSDEVLGKLKAAYDQEQSKGPSRKRA